MPALEPVITIIVMLLLGLGAAWLASRRGWPLPTLLMVAGFVGSELLVAAGIDTGLRWYNFRDLVYFVLLPLLVYETAFRLNADALWHTIVIVMLLAVPLMLLEVLVAAAMLYFGIGDSAGFPVVAALIAAALIATNDPAAVDRVLEGNPATPRMRSILEGESLFNSILALVLVSLALHVESQHASLREGISFLEGFIYFVQLFSGGILLGFAIGLSGWVVLHFVRSSWFRAAFSIAIAYGSWFAAEWLAGVSGVVAALIAGLLLNAYVQRAEPETKVMLRRCWKLLGSGASMVLFLLLGMSIYLPLLLQQWQAALLGILALLLARGLMIFAGLGGYNYFAGHSPVPVREQIALFFGGIKGAVTVALLFTLPAHLRYGDTLQAIVYAVVIFSLLLQAPVLRYLLRCGVCCEGQDSTHQSS